MNLNFPAKSVNQLPHNELTKKRAIHVAGHAVAIYLGSRKNDIPPFFQIFIKNKICEFRLPRSLTGCNDKFNSQQDQDRWVQTMPALSEKGIRDISLEQVQQYKSAFETNIISLLAGPLAEAKYVAMRDGELINPRLVNLDALPNYGGTEDLEIIHEYLEYFIFEDAEKEKKISDLFLEAFTFINDKTNWLVITMLANYILTTRKSFIDYEEVVPYLLSKLTDPD
jgi:hypothetical protein